MTTAEHRLLVLALAWILATIPPAILVWQVWLRRRPVHPVIPHEDAAPAGSFLDVALPPPLPPAAQRGLPVRHWKAMDGWVALGVVAVLTVMMGPMTIDPEKAGEFKLSAALLMQNLVFQVAFAGLLWFYLAVVRGMKPAQVLGMKNQPPLLIPVWALAWIFPGTILVGMINLVTMPWVLKLLGQTEASPQMIVDALKVTPDSSVKLLVFLTVGFGAPLMEELIFRGFLYSVAKRFTHWSYAALSTSLFFAVVHGNVMSFLPLTLLGLLFTAAYEQTKNILVPMTMHALFNLMQVSILFYAPELAKQLEKAS